MVNNHALLQWLTVLAGAWLAISIWVIPAADPVVGLASAVQINQILVGIAVIAAALAGVFAFRIWEEWVLALLGLWLIASPWLLGFSDLGGFVITDVVVGLFVVATSGWVVFTDNAAA